MFHSRRYPLQIATQPAPLVILFQDHREGFSNAAELLAGTRGRCLVQDIVERLQANPAVDRRTGRMLADLLDILSLENVHLDGSGEAGFFAKIDTASPVVEEICLLTDALQSALGQLPDHAV